MSKSSFHLFEINFIFSDPDIIIGTLSTYQGFSEFYAPSVPYLWNHLTVCFKKPEKIPRWQHIFLVFDPDTQILWLYSFILLLCVVFLVFTFSEFEKIKLDIITVIIWTWGMTMGGVTPFKKYCLRSMSRIHLGGAMIYVFWIMGVYNSIFFQTFIHPKYASRIESLDEAVSSNYKFIATQDFLVSFHENKIRTI